MKEWLERFKEWLLAEDYVHKEKERNVEAEVETYEEEYEQLEPQVAPIPVSGKHLTIRTANIYPKQTVERDVERRKASKYKKVNHTDQGASVNARTLSKRKRERGNFPFPLIPDDIPIQQHMRAKDAEENTSREQQVPVQPASYPAKTPHEEKEGRREAPRKIGENKRPFRPTEIISPIYGRKRPEEMEEDEPIKEEIPREQAFNTLIHPMEFKQQTKIEVNDAQLQEKHMPVEEKESFPIKGEEERLPSTEADERIARMEREMPPQPQPQQIIADRSSRWEPAAELIEKKEEPAPAPMLLEQKVESTGDQRLLSNFSIQPMREKPVQPEPPQWSGPSTAMPTPIAPIDGIYKRPGLSLLMAPPNVQTEDTEHTNRQREVLATTLHNFNVNAEVIGAVRGPTVTRYEIQPAPGVKVNKITNLIDDIKLSLAARDVRIEAPIPGRSAVGIEVPNEHSEPVFLRSILESKAFEEAASPLTVALGMDIGGEPILADLAKMPHGLIAGATGSGKSVCINSIILSLLYKATPDQVRLLLVDPKVVELAPYNHLPHLVTPVVTDPKQATAALKWAVQEMDSRYEKFAEAGARDISRYNDLMRRAYPDDKEYLMPSIVIIIDELADLMMVAPHDVEEAICRIAQKARACGIHLLVATQRPSVDVITGLIKANIPTRIAFSVSSQIDSRTILDMNGAERLLGRGDMLYLSSGSSKPVRLQGPYVSDDEIESVTAQICGQTEPNYLFEKEDLTQAMMSENTDELFAEVVRFCVENGQASASLLQRNFQVGYNRAARLIDMMEEKGFISGQTGNSKPRDVFLTMAEYEELFNKDAR
ncbi:DNA translocase FtsK [Aneurinibacillus sp. REN35]|uniref:DNA translocase FtsK n=1 Tax=Aneurinibacillus sp. REN35 TaxID=3237286 RepID=UPI003528935A